MPFVNRMILVCVLQCSEDASGYVLVYLDLWPKVDYGFERALSCERKLR